MTARSWPRVARLGAPGSLGRVALVAAFIAPVLATVGPARDAAASPPAGWAPDAAGWALPLAGARSALRAARTTSRGYGSEGPVAAADGAEPAFASEASPLDRAAVWLSMVPEAAVTRRIAAAFRLELALARGDFAAAERYARAQLDGCLPLENAPWATDAVEQIVAGSPSLDAAWALLQDAPLAADAIEALLALQPPAPVERAAVRRLLVEAPDHPRARAVADDVDLVGLAALLPEIPARVERAEALLEAHDNDRALREARAWLEASSPSPPAACRLAFVAAKAARKARRYSDALNELERTRRLCDAADDASRWLRAVLLESQVLRILSRPAAIRRNHDAAAARAPEHSFLDDLLFLQADALDGADRSRAAAAVHRELVEAYPDGDMAPRSAWRLARGLMDRDPEAARTWLHRAADLTEPGTRGHERALYWRARLDERAAPDEARDTYAALFRRVGYYGMLARSRLERLAPEAARAVEADLRAARSVTPAPPAPSAARAAAKRVAQQLDAAWAAAVVEELACTADGDRRFELAEILVELEDHAAAQRVLRPAAEAVLVEFGRPSLAAWRTAYSRPYAPAVEAAARAEGLDPWLLFGLAREESTFDADIISWAGAIGLTQLMPATAVGAYAAVFRRPLPDLDALTDPALNARLGARVLKEGFDRWDHAPLAISAYNAGSGLTSRFLSSSPLPLDRFVEGISVRQTRGYVQRVIESWGRYRLIYSNEPFIRLPAAVQR